METTKECEVIVENCEATITTTDKDVPKVQEEQEEELLGSLTTYNNNEGSESKTQQLRTSARVYKKMKLDSTPSVTSETAEKPEEEKDGLPKLQHKKVLRMLWTSHDKDLFFEALNEYGKDFENIHAHLCSKSKRSLPDYLVKTKDQVRHLYYRTWHMILKYVRFPDCMKKVAQELYGLINYGELRRKMRFVTTKLLLKLPDLIYRGSIAIRDRGKTIRIKTPMCRALRRLNQLDERYDELKLPSRIVLELKPKNMYAYLKVQSMAQNPRLRTIVPLYKRLSNVLVSVSKKWKTVEADIYDQAIVSRSPITNDCVPSEAETEANKKLLSPLLRITPPSDTAIEIPSINLSEYFTRQSICLRAYETKIGIKSSESVFLSQNEAHQKLLSKTVPKKAVTTESDSTQPQENNQPLSAIKDVVTSIIQLQNAMEGAVQEKVEDKPTEIEQDDILETQVTSRVAEIRKGWVLPDCGSVSVGDLYLMFGKQSKLVLEYSWDEPQKQLLENTKATEEVEDSKTKIEVDIEQDTQGSADQVMDQNESDWESNITSALRKLISVAKLHYQKNNSQVCGQKTNSHLKSRSKSNKVQTFEQTEFHDEVTPEENLVEAEQSNINENISSASHLPLFRRPSVPLVPMEHLYSQLPKLKNQYTNRKHRRERMKQVVVQRKLSLLPNNTEGHQIVQLNIIPQGNKPSEAPVIQHDETMLLGTSPVVAAKEDDSFQIEKMEVMSLSNTISVGKSEESFQLEKMEVMQSNMQEVTSCDEFIASQIEGIDSTPSTSPSRILKEGDNQWLNAEVADFSLSSFLGHLDSPCKSLLSASCSEDCVMNEETLP